MSYRPENCCGQHLVCEREALLVAASSEIEYYDDEELDRFKGVEPDMYDDEAVEEFREVLYTMRPNEVSGWLRSLQLRAVNLPVQIVDEALMFID
jgi:hypothetical protein